MRELTAPWNGMLQQLRQIGGGDSEREQAFIRVGIGILLLVYYTFPTLQVPPSARRPDTGSLVLLLLLTVVLLLHVLTHAGAKPWRRLAGSMLDVFSITYFFFTSDAAAVPMYALYLWIIFGNGFRYGQRYLYFSLALSLVGFGLAVLHLPQWRSHPSLAWGLWFGMLAVSLYVAHLVRRLRTALEVAEAANMAKRRFVSSVSHELRTPLNVIIGMGTLLKASPLDHDQQDMLASLEDASRLMLGLIEDVLDFSKIEAGKVCLEAAPFDLENMMESATGLLRYQAMGKDLKLYHRLRSGTPTSLIGDQHHLKQIMVNLLSNAIKFTHSGEVGCEVSLLRQEAEQVWLRFEVIDTGIGIPLSAQARVFESFTQADDSTTRRYGGTGLGTTIAKQLVELMDGRIGLVSTPGKGSLFWFELPLRLGPDSSRALQYPRRHDDELAGRSETRPASMAPLRRSLRVLVAEDNSTNAKVLQRVLERSGHSFEVVPDGEQALDRLANSQFDVALFDMNMPVLSGLDAARAYRFMAPRGRGVPIAMFSADASVDTREECLSAGVDAYLTKPIQPDLLLRTIAELARSSPPACSRESLSSHTGSTADTAKMSQLDMSALAELEALGGSPHFVQTLISGYIDDNRKLVERLEAGAERQRLQECREVLHAMKGAAVSIGAIGMRRFCEDVERLDPQELFRLRRSIVARCKETFNALCVEVERKYIKNETRIEDDGGSRSSAPGT